MASSLATSNHGVSSSAADEDSRPHWSSLFSSTKIKLQFVAPAVKDGKKSVIISKSVLDQGISLWDDCLIGQFFGSPPQAVSYSICGY